MTAALLSVEKLSVAFGGRSPVRDVSFDVRPGEILALVGESGSGKTLSARALLGLLPFGAAAAGRAFFQGVDLISLDEAGLRAVRGGRIGMVFQEPMSSLNPSMKVGVQLAEGLRLHGGLSAEAARAQCVEMLRRVGLRDPEAALDRYPHHFSGGMRQRLMLASVMLLKPALLVADEPTTALDVLVQKDVLELMVELAGEAGAGVLLITHDLGLVAEYAHRTVVMRHGEVVETGPTAALLAAPRTDYVRDLLAALPQRAAMPRPRVRTSVASPASASAPLVRIDDVVVCYRGARPAPWRAPTLVPSLAGVTLDIRRGETLAVVGESGSGKTTLARAILRLVDTTSGSIRFDGLDVRALTRENLRRYRQRVRIVFQDPFSALDPRLRVADIVAEGLRHDRSLSRAAKRERSLSMLEAVGLSTDFAGRFPHQLSGGQRQRVNIARALIADPELVIADEPVSALDLTVQAEVLRLLSRLQRERGFSCLFISHALGVVEQIADRVAVIRGGRLLELGPRDAVFDRPAHPYTRALLRAAPRLQARPEGGYALKPYPAAGADLEVWDTPASSGASTMTEISPGHLVRSILNAPNERPAA